MLHLTDTATAGINFTVNLQACHNITVRRVICPTVHYLPVLCSQPDILDISGIRILLCYTRSDVYVLRPVKGNPINISWGGESIRGNGGAVRWQSIRRLIHRFP
ncbi:hypothetical protein I5Z76_03708 [Escherichia coli]